MAQTTVQGFDSVVQAASGTAWTNLNAMLDDDTDVAFVYLSGSGAESNLVRLRNPLAGVEIPAEASITNIEIKIRCYLDSATSSQPRLEQVRIGTGTAHISDIISQTSAASETFSGNLAYWGLTDAEAADFISGVDRFEFIVELNAAGDETINVEWVSCQFNFRSSVVPLPGVF